MTATVGEFAAEYAAGLRRFLELRSDASLEAGHELGRRALAGGVSLLEIVENHFQVIAGLTREERYAALQFLLQTLTVLDIATRSFLDGNKRYEQERSRADDLAERDAFRRALVDSMQDGFFVADHTGTIIEINGALADMTGYGGDGLPYRWPYPWLTLDRSAREAPFYLNDCAGRSEFRILHRDGRSIWLSVSANSVRSPDGTEVMYVGTARDVTAEHEAAESERAVASLATALVAATSVADVLTIGMDECRESTGADRAVAAVWPDHAAEPTVYRAGSRTPTDWAALDETTRECLAESRHAPPLTVTTAGTGLAAALGTGHDAALWLDYATHAPTNADRALLRLMVGHLALAMARARTFDHERATSLTLQRAMLAPLVLPPGFAVRYQPAEVPLEIGGDWYDVVPLLEHGRIGIVVGDCVGSGLIAAVVMGQLRSSCRALLLRGAGPGQLLDELDALARRTPGAACTTVCAAILEPGTGELIYSSAGHPPAYVCDPDGRVTVLDEGRSLPLATFDCSPRPEAKIRLAPGSTLVLFTDGLVERRHVPLDAGLALASAVLTASCGQPVDEVADQILAGLAPDSGYDDDVAMVVYRCPPAPFRLDIDAVPTELARVRAALREWLASASVAGTRADDLVCAVNELCTNSIEHAYGAHSDGAANVHVAGIVAAAEVHIEVTDAGSWVERESDRSGLRGRGLPMARAMVDDLTIAAGESGTTVRLRARLVPSSEPVAAPTRAS